MIMWTGPDGASARIRAWIRDPRSRRCISARAYCNRYAYVPAFSCHVPSCDARAQLQPISPAVENHLRPAH